MSCIHTYTHIYDKISRSVNVSKENHRVTVWSRTAETFRHTHTHTQYCSLFMPNNTAVTGIWVL